MKKLVKFFNLCSILLIVGCSKNEETSSSVNYFLPIKATTYDLTTTPPSIIDVTNYNYYPDRKLKNTISTIESYNWKEEYAYSGDKIVKNISSNKLIGDANWNLQNTRIYDYYANGKIKSLLDVRPGLPKSFFRLEYNSNDNVLCYQSTINEAGDEFKHSFINIYYDVDKVVKVEKSLYNQNLGSYNVNVDFTDYFFWDNNKNKFSKDIIGLNELIYNSLQISKNSNTLGKVSVNNSTGETTGSSNSIIYEYNVFNFPIKKKFLDQNGQVIKEVIYEYVRI